MEVVSGRQLLNATRSMSWDCWPPSPIVLEFPPVSSIVSVKYIDTNGTEQTVAASTYKLGALSGKLSLAYGQTWPTARQELEAITVTYVCGYGATRDLVPRDLRHAVLLIAAARHMNREDDTATDSFAERLASAYNAKEGG